MGPNFLTQPDPTQPMDIPDHVHLSLTRLFIERFAPDRLFGQCFSTASPY